MHSELRSTFAVNYNNNDPKGSNVIRNFNRLGLSIANSSSFLVPFLVKREGITRKAWPSCLQN